MFKRIAYASIGIVFMAVAAYAATIPLLTGPNASDPSQILGTLNQLIGSINNNVQNKLYGNAVAVNTTAITTEETLFTYTLPAGYLANAGDTVVAECSEASAATANNKTLRLYFGASVITTGAVASNGTGMYLKMSATRGATSTAQAFVGTGTAGAAGVSPVAVTNTAGTDDMAAAIVIKCTGQNGTAAANDMSGKMMIVESLK